MNLTALRADIASALNAPDLCVDLQGAPATLRVAPRFKALQRPGVDGLVRFDHAVRDVSGFGFMVTCQALILLPQDLADAELWIDANVSALTGAVSSAAILEDVTPVSLALDTGAVPALQLTAVRAD